MQDQNTSQEERREGGAITANHPYFDWQALTPREQSIIARAFALYWRVASHNFERVSITWGPFSEQMALYGEQMITFADTLSELAESSDRMTFGSLLISLEATLDPRMNPLPEVAGE